MRWTEDILRRRAQLVATSAVQRERIGGQLATLQGPFALADRGVTGARWLRGHPAVAVGGLVFLLVAARGRAAKVARTALFAWRSWKLVRELAQKAGLR